MNEDSQIFSRAYLRPSVWSNVVFLIPLGFALAAHLTWYSALLSAAIFFSVLYHSFEHETLHRIDVFLALSVISANLYLCYLSHIWNIYVALAIISVVIAFYFFFQEQKGHREFNHALWHIWCGVISVWCIVAYALKG